MLKYLMILTGLTVLHVLCVIYLGFHSKEPTDLLIGAFIILYCLDRDKFKGREL